MTGFEQAQTNWSPLKRYTLAFTFFLIALLVRLSIARVESGLPFLTFYPAMVVTFYLCGIGPGIFLVALSAVTAYYLFIPPFYSFSFSHRGIVAVLTFYISASLIGLIIKQMQRSLSLLKQSEQRCQSMLEDQTEFICRFQTDGTILFVNEAFCRMFGKNRESLIGSKWHPVVFPEDMPNINEKLETLSPSNPVVIIENRVITADGTVRWGQFVNRAFYDEAGRLLEIQSVGRDISEQKKLENAIAANEKEFRLLAESMPQIVWITRSDGWNIYFNHQWVDYTGLTLEESYGHGWNKPFHPEDQQRSWDAWQNAVNNHGTYSLECRLRRADGEYRWWLVRGVPVPDENGNVSRWFGTCTDIHGIKQAEQSQKKLNEELKESQERAKRASVLYKMLSDISSANIHIRQRDQLFNSTCQIIQESGLFRMVWIGLLDNKSGALTPVAHAGYVEGYLDNLDINIHDNERGGGPSAMTVKTGVHVTSDDIANDPRMRPWREEALKRGYLASATFPITQSGQTIGVLTLYINQVGLLDEELVKTLKGMMEDISFSLDFIAESQRRETIQKDLHELTKHLQTVLENERTRIARELHDELGQSMTALRFDLKWLHEKISTKEEHVHDRLKAMNDLLSQTVDSIRRISEDLRPGMLDNLGLAAAIESHVAKFTEQTGIICDLSMNQADFDVGAQLATALFRIVQESLTNVARHSGANHVIIRLHEQGDNILLIVQDNGHGLPSAPDGRRKTFGLLGMRERISMLGGTLDIFNEKDAGVRIEACVPKQIKEEP